MNRIAVMQITDTLALGGLERVAVNLANNLPRDHYRSHLCVSRDEGELKPLVASHVKYFHMGRSSRLDLAALTRLLRYIRENEIQILHAHGTSLFIAALASILRRRTAVIWHDHFGRSECEERPVGIYAAATRAVDGVIAVTEKLADWSRQKLHVPPDRVWYIPNFVCSENSRDQTCNLPGTPGFRIVCVANLRPEKDHLTLLAAMNLVVREIPEAHLILVGGADNPSHLEKIKRSISEQRLAGHVSWLGPRTDVPAILRNCDIGVLSSASEGLPLSLIEYGLAGLPAIATHVGQCAEVLEHGRSGVLVPPCSPELLSTAIRKLLRSTTTREAFAKRFSRHVERKHGVEVVVRKICRVYDTALSK